MKNKPAFAQTVLFAIGLGVMLLGSPLFSQEPAQEVTIDPEDCGNAQCHASILERRYVHDALEDDCTTCHESNGNPHPTAEGPEYSLSEDPPDLCYSCHDENNTRSVVHSPVEDGDCLTCHDPHGSPNKFFLAYASIDSLCQDCHDLDFQELPVLHGPVKAGECTSCHNPHESDTQALLQEPKPGLCFSCHSEVEEQAGMATLHPPFEEDCQDCHEPHGSTFPSLLVEKVPTLCYDCHDDVQETAKTSPVKHSPVFDKKSCLNCHSPHSSNVETLLTNSQKNLCFECHNQKIKVDGRTIANIQKVVEQSNYLHEPLESDGCVVCHQPHGAPYAALLESTFPRKNYAEPRVENYELCFGCHDSEMMLAPIVDSDITDFRDGRRNLHYLHINQKKGRTCRNCHNVHGAERPRLIPAHVPFGKWEMPIKFQFKKNGGTCQPGCHEALTYERD
ncbi:MAG: hypothetical protein GXO78_08760 [Calditrichaeota bacterium]|nr:hypothetical protein [Calditrichota bacterium]